MSKLVKDIVDVCLKEDLQKVLQKTTELKEMSAFGREFAQQMRQKHEGGVYRSKITGQNIRLQYATPKSTDKISSAQYAKERQMAKQNMAPAPATKTAPVKPPGSIGRGVIPPSEAGLSSAAPTPKPQAASPAATDRISSAQYAKERRMAKQNMAPAPATKTAPAPEAPKPVSRPPAQPTAATGRRVDVSVTPSNKASGMARGPSPDQPPRMPEPKGSAETDKYFSAVNARRAQQDYSQPAASEYKTPAEPKASVPAPKSPEPASTPNLGAPTVGDSFEKNDKKPQTMKESFVSVGSNKYRIL